MIRSYRFRLQMNRQNGQSFEAAMASSNELYNAALEERISAWSKAGKSITHFDQIKSLTIVRAQDLRFAAYATTMLRTPLVEINEAFKGFFGRVKRGQTPGFPRFRSLKRLRSFGFTEASGWKLKSNRLTMKGLPTVRLKMHRTLEGKPLKLTIKRDSQKRWFAIIVVRLPDVFGPTGQGATGIDLGVENLVTDDTGCNYGKLSPDRAGAAKRSMVERAIARQRRGSRRWKKSVQRLGVLRQREADTRRTRHFQVASKIVAGGAQIIVVEDLKLRNMTRSAKGTVETPGKNVAAKSGLNRSILDAGLAQFIQILTDKAESAGRLVITVDPRGTSQMCSLCGTKVKKSLGQRRHRCVCGLDLHRDHNGARNVLHRGVVVPARQPALAG